MAGRDAGEAGGSARHARKRLQAALGDAPAGLLLDGNGDAPFEYRGPAGVPPGASPHSPFAGSAHDRDPAPAAVGPVLRWRVGQRLAVLLGVLSVAAGAWFWWEAASGRPEILPLSGISSGSPVEDSAPAGDQAAGGATEPARDANGRDSSGSVVVHVAGAVARPGVVHLPAGGRVHEAIAAAGGGLPGADLNRLNLALAVEDGQKIHVPREGEEGLGAGQEVAGPDGGGGAGGGAGTLADGKINLNTAGVEELDALPKVGPVLAQRIVDWRKEHGAFKNVEELDAVDGVGPKMLEALLPLVTV